MNNSKDELLKNLDESSKSFEEAMNLIKQKQETYWNTLSKQQQLMVFCVVSRRIYEGDIVQKRSYRGVLYDVFGFGPEAYVPAQMSGYLSIHNAIFDSEHMDQILMEFCKENNIENAQEKVDKYILKYHY